MKRLRERFARLWAPGESEPSAAASAAPTAPADSDPAADRRQGVIQALRQQVALKSGGRLTVDEVDPDAQMFDRGYLDSFSYVEFLAFIEHAYQVRIDDSELAGHLRTIAAMADHVLRPEGARR